MEAAMEGKMNRAWLGPDAMITALGEGAAALAAIEAGRTGCDLVDDPRLWGEPFVAGRVDGFQPTEGYTRLEAMFAGVIGEVVSASGVDPAASDTLLIVASTKGNIELLDPAETPDERVYLGEMAARVAERCGFTGARPLIISNACISGVSALVTAARLVLAGDYRNVIVAGGDTLSRFVVTGFQAFRSVSGSLCRPYDASRDGLTLGEGCAAVLVTANAGKAAKPLVEIAGGATAADANHISGPSRTGDGLWFAIRGAMVESGAEPTDVAFVNGHGTGTVYNDEMESKAFALAGLADRPITGLKPYFGHTLGASGVIETIVSAHALRCRMVYGTLGFEHTGTPVALNVSPENRAAQGSVCVKTASGFGGCNAAIVLRRHENTPPTVQSERIAPTIRPTASVRITPDGRPFAEMIRARFRALESPDAKFFKMDDLCKLGYVAASEILKNASLTGKYRPEEIGIIMANRSSSMDSDHRHVAHIEHTYDASPAVFVYTLPNVACGEISIRHKLQGESTFFIEPTRTTARAEAHARAAIASGHLRAAIYGWCELVGEEFEAELTLLETNIAPERDK